MAVSRAFREFVLDQLSGIADLTSRPMFGGLGLSAGDEFFRTGLERRPVPESR